MGPLFYFGETRYNEIVFPDSKVHGANMGPTWALSAQDGPHVGPMHLAIGVILPSSLRLHNLAMCVTTPKGWQYYQAYHTLTNIPAHFSAARIASYITASLTRSAKRTNMARLPLGSNYYSICHPNQTPLLHHYKCGPQCYRGLVVLTHCLCKI